MCTITWKLKLGTEKRSIIHSPKKYPYFIRRVFILLGLLALLFISALLTWTLALYQMTISTIFSDIVRVYAWIIQYVFQCSRACGVIFLVHITILQVCVGVTLFKFMWNVNKSDKAENVFSLPFLYCRTQCHFVLHSIMIILF